MMRRIYGWAQKIVLYAHHFAAERAARDGRQSDETAVICAIAKDEERYVDEWIRYHLKLGFDRIYIYDNSREHTLRDLGARHGDRVHVVHFPGRCRHIPAYKHFLFGFRHHTWVAYIDLDEFIVLKQHARIGDLLREHCRRGALSLNWHMFGSSGETELRLAPVLERFQRRGAKTDIHVKTISRISDVLDVPGTHFTQLFPGTQQRDTSGKPLNGPFNPDGPTDVAVIHHYFLKSREEFDEKVLRGLSDASGQRAFDDFDAFDVNEVHDPSAWEFFSR